MCSFQIRTKSPGASTCRCPTTIRTTSTAAQAKYRTVTGLTQEEWTNGTQKNTNMIAASYQASCIFIRNTMPTTACPNVSNSSTRCSESKTIGVTEPTLIDRT